MALNLEQQASELIQRARRILVITRRQADVDGISSLMGLGLALHKLHKTFDLVIPNFDRASLPNFLPTTLDLRSEIGAIRAFHLRVNVKDIPLSELLYDINDDVLDVTLVPQKNEWSPQDINFRHGDDRYDLIIALDCPDMGALGQLTPAQTEFFYRTPLINLDCQAANEHWGRVNLVDVTAASTSEVLYRWILQWNQSLLDEQIATCFLAGMIARTHGFRASNVTPRTLEASSRLVELGAKREQIVHGLWRTQTVSGLKLWGRALSRLQHDTQSGLLWTSLSQADFIETGATDEHLARAMDELLATTPNARAILFLQQTTDGITGHLQTVPPLIATDLTRPFNGLGSRDRASFLYTETSDFVRATQSIVALVTELLKK